VTSDETIEPELCNPDRRPFFFATCSWLSHISEFPMQLLSMLEGYISSRHGCLDPTCASLRISNWCVPPSKRGSPRPVVTLHYDHLQGPEASASLTLAQFFSKQSSMVTGGAAALQAVAAYNESGMPADTNYPVKSCVLSSP
jgi:hypothetical protein